MNSEPKESSNFHRLLIDIGALFDCPFEWCITDFVYFRSNTQPARTWVCRASHIQECTPVKRRETVYAILERLVQKKIGFSKVEYGKPQKQRNGNVVQPYQYSFNAEDFDKWVKAEVERLAKTDTKADRPSDRKRTAKRYESGPTPGPKTDAIMNIKNEERKGIEENEIVHTESTSPSIGLDASCYSVSSHSIQLPKGSQSESTPSTPPEGAVVEVGEKISLDDVFRDSIQGSAELGERIANGDNIVPGAVDFDFEELRVLAHSATRTLPRKENDSYTPPRLKNPYYLQESDPNKTPVETFRWASTIKQ